MCHLKLGNIRNKIPNLKFRHPKISWKLKLGLSVNPLLVLMPRQICMVEDYKHWNI